MTAFIILINYKEMLRMFGTGAPLTAVLFIVLSFTTAYLFD